MVEAQRYTLRQLTNTISGLVQEGTGREFRYSPYLQKQIKNAKYRAQEGGGKWWEEPPSLGNRPKQYTDEQVFGIIDELVDQTRQEGIVSKRLRGLGITEKVLYKAEAVLLYGADIKLPDPPSLSGSITDAFDDAWRSNPFEHNAPDADDGTLGSPVPKRPILPTGYEGATILIDNTQEIK